MNVLVDCPRSSPLEWRWRLLDVDIRVTVWFWISVALLCPAQDTGGVLIWVGVCLFAVLIHEFGHVFALRRDRGNGDIALYLWGGMTIPYHALRSVRSQVSVALAGSIASIAITLLTVLVAALTGAEIRAGWHLVFPVLGAVPAVRVAPPQLTYYWYAFLNDMIGINL